MINVVVDLHKMGFSSKEIADKFNFDPEEIDYILEGEGLITIKEEFNAAKFNELYKNGYSLKFLSIKFSMKQSKLKKLINFL